MKNLFKFIKYMSRKTSIMTTPNALYCNDPIEVEELCRRIEYKEAFFNFYAHCSHDNKTGFSAYLVKMIKQCRLYMYSLPINERQSFFEFCLMHKVDISDESLEIASRHEEECYAELNTLSANAAI